MELAGFASLDTDEHSDLLLHSDSLRWGYWVHHSSQEHCWAFPSVMPDCRSVAGVLFTKLLLVLRVLLELITLRILTMVSLVRWSLIPLLKTLLGIGMRVGVTSRSLPLKPPLLGFHLFALSSITIAWFTNN